MARRRGFGALPLIGVLTAPKLIALGVGAWAYLRSRAPSGPALDVEAKPQSSMLPSIAPGLTPVASAAYSDPYAASVADPYYDAPASDYTPPSPFTDVSQPPSQYVAPSQPYSGPSYVSRTGTNLLSTQPKTASAPVPTTQPSSIFAVYGGGSAMRVSSGGTIGTKTGTTTTSEDSGRALKGLRRPRN